MFPKITTLSVAILCFVVAPACAQDEHISATVCTSYEEAIDTLSDTKNQERIFRGHRLKEGSFIEVWANRQGHWTVLDVANEEACYSLNGEFWEGLLPNNAQKEL